jgi:hypothetical protein
MSKTKKRFTSKLTNAIEAARPDQAKAWGYKACPGKGGRTQNSNIIKKETD